MLSESIFISVYFSNISDFIEYEKSNKGISVAFNSVRKARKAFYFYPESKINENLNASHCIGLKSDLKFPFFQREKINCEILPSK